MPDRDEARRRAGARKQQEREVPEPQARDIYLRTGTRSRPAEEIEVRELFSIPRNLNLDRTMQASLRALPTEEAKARPWGQLILVLVLCLAVLFSLLRWIQKPRAPELKKREKLTESSGTVEETRRPEPSRPRDEGLNLTLGTALPQAMISRQKTQTTASVSEATTRPWRERREESRASESAYRLEAALQEEAPQAPSPLRFSLGALPETTSLPLLPLGVGKEKKDGAFAEALRRAQPLLALSLELEDNAADESYRLSLLYNSYREGGDLLEWGTSAVQESQSTEGAELTLVAEPFEILIASEIVTYQQVENLIYTLDREGQLRLYELTGTSPTLQDGELLLPLQTYPLATNVQKFRVGADGQALYFLTDASLFAYWKDRGHHGQSISLTRPQYALGTTALADLVASSVIDFELSRDFAVLIYIDKQGTAWAQQVASGQQQKLLEAVPENFLTAQRLVEDTGFSYLPDELSLAID